VYITDDCSGNTFTNNVVIANGIANGNNGITITNASTGNSFFNNKIGVASNGTAVANFSDGINISGSSTDNIIGGVNVNEGNKIAYNGRNGIQIVDAGSNLNSIHKNSIYCNALRGIKLNNAGNNDYPAPVILGTSTGTLIVGTANPGDIIEIFGIGTGCATCTPGSNSVQGRYYLGTDTADASGNWSYSYSGNKDTITATASTANTTTAHNTSEFSSCVLCVAGTPDINGTFNQCANTNNVSFTTTDNSGSGATYLWTVTGGLTISGTATDNDVMINVGASGGTLTVTESATGGCPASDMVTITINPATTQATAGADQATCITTLSALTGNTPTVGTGTWNVLAGGTATVTDPTDPNSDVTGLTNGANEFEWVITGSCGITRDTVVINKGTSGLVTNLTADNDTICAGSSVDLNVTTIGGTGTLQYTWASSDNSFNVTNNSATVSVTPAEGTISYFVVVSDANGCTSPIDTAKVTGIGPQSLVVPNLITPNGDKHNDCFIIKDANNLDILPGSTFEMYNRWGQAVYKDDDLRSGDFCGASLADGMYYYLIKSGCGDKEYKGWLHIISNEASNK
ncbi:MAG: gliding motility-associated C-terminal domain-containing protein, partial [Cytophagaceae bacterium]|nr:gliding motility-associated C-terminal domain-containing protein [Cytophagaceae bacterium]